MKQYLAVAIFISLIMPFGDCHASDDINNIPVNIPEYLINGEGGLYRDKKDPSIIYLIPSFKKNNNAQNPDKYRKESDNNSPQPDFGPYMKNLQKKIKRNWDPPQADKSKRIIVFFKIGRDGNILESKVNQSSGNIEADNAALLAIQSSTPFNPLPEEYKGNDVDVQFTFDYNVFGAKGSRKY